MPETSNGRFSKVSDIDLRQWVDVLNGSFGKEANRFFESRVVQIALNCLKNKEELKDFYEERGRVKGVMEFKGFLDGILREWRQRIERNAAAEKRDTKSK